MITDIEITEQDFIIEGGLKTSAAVKAFKAAKNKLDGVKKVKTELQKVYDHLRFSVLPKLMEEDDITNLTVDIEGEEKPIRVRVQDETYASIPAGQRPEAYRWLKDNGKGELVIETVNASTLKALVNEMAKKGESLPDNLFKVTFSPGARFY